ncbi:MAG TPA: AAA family ATPase [Gemmatimonadaceae bacterium]|nr:AAA family ATPase [Gemmatimonadaceae bacterium]
MFTRIQTRSFRCLKSVDQTLGPFRALVGPNASGKTTFLDVVGLLGDLIKNRGDVLRAIQERSTDFEKLLWMGKGRAFELAVEAEIPDAIKEEMAEEKQRFSRIRYEVEIALDPKRNEIGLDHETLWLREVADENEPAQRELFPAPQKDASSIFSRQGKGLQVAINKTPGGNDNYYPDGKKKSFKPSYKLGRTTSALANIPADTESFPVSTWFRNLLEKGVQPFMLNSQVIRQPSPPGLGLRFQTDGSNLPWVIAELHQDEKRFRAWLEHVRTALEDIKDIDTIELPENKHRYLVIEYVNGAEVPSWLASDGTLRLLTLTIPAYLHDLEGTFLIEEPENGIHPRAIETVLQSLSSIYRSQVLVATHSPVALNMLEPRDVLCFAKDIAGATDIVSGDRHPALRDWKKGEPDLGVLFASGILS